MLPSIMSAQACSRPVTTLRAFSGAACASLDASSASADSTSSLFMLFSVALSWIDAHQSVAVGGRGSGEAAEHDAAIPLDGDALGAVIEAVEIDRHETRARERGVQRSRRGVASQRKVAIDAAGMTRDVDAPVRTQRHCQGVVTFARGRLAQVGADHPASTETGVERTVGVEPHELEQTGGPDAAAR